MGVQQNFLPHRQLQVQLLLPHQHQIVCLRFSNVIRHLAMQTLLKELMIVYQTVWFLSSTTEEFLREDFYSKMLNEARQLFKDWGCFVSSVQFKIESLLDALEIRVPSRK